MTTKDIIITWSIIGLFIVGITAFYIWLFATYGNKPASEVPMWILWLLFRRNSK